MIDQATLDFVQSLQDLIEQPTARTKQVKVGPSSLGNPCDLCLAKELNDINLAPEEVQHDGGNLAAWIGTCIHFYIQHLIETDPKFTIADLLIEADVPCGLIPGYGLITGHVDLFHIPTGTLVDWKSSKLAKMRGYKMNGSGQQYRVQRSLYGIGCENLGHEVRNVVNFYIPRDGWKFSENWPEIQPFDRDLGQRAIKRATTIWQDYVLTNQIEELGSDDDCFNCGSGDWGALSKITSVTREPTNGNTQSITTSSPYQL